MNVTRGRIITRGLTHRCPNCGAPSLFAEGKWFELNRNCPSCQLKIEKDEGFFLGAMSLNYFVTLVVWLLPIAILWSKGVLPETPAIVLALAGAMLVPVLLYRASRSWQLMLYYTVFPQHLPANRRALSALEDENI